MSDENNVYKSGDKVKWSGYANPVKSGTIIGPVLGIENTYYVLTNNNEGEIRMFKGSALDRL